MSPRVKVQHYVPQLLLRLHAHELAAKRGAEQVWCFDKQTDRVFSPNIRGVAAEARFYEAEVDGQTFSLEDALARLESRAAPALARVVERRTLQGLKRDDRVAIAAFTATQFMRTPSIREEAAAMQEGLVAALMARGIDPSVFPEAAPMSGEDIKLLSLDLLLDTPETFAPHFLNKHWHLIAATPEDPFHIGDNPVVRDNTTVRGPYGRLGVASPGVEIYLPLSPTLCLGMVDPTVVEDLEGKFAQVKRTHFKLQKLRAKKARQAGRPKPTEEMDIADAALRDLQARVRPFLNGTPSPYEPEVVTRVNSLQMAYATRWVISSTSDFSLPKRMIADDEKFRRGPAAQMHWR